MRSPLLSIPDLMPPPLIGAGIKRCFCLTSVCLTSVAYIGPKSRTERHRKTKIGIEVTHVTSDSDTTFRVKRSKVKVTRPLWLAVQVTTKCISTRPVSTPPPRASRCLSIMNFHGARKARWRRRRKACRLWTGGGPQRVYNGRGHIVSPCAQLILYK